MKKFLILILSISLTTSAFARWLGTEGKQEPAVANARTDTAQNWTGLQTFNTGISLPGADTTGKVFKATTYDGFEGNLTGTSRVSVTSLGLNNSISNALSTTMSNQFLSLDNAGVSTNENPEISTIITNVSIVECYSGYDGTYAFVEAGHFMKDSGQDILWCTNNWWLVISAPGYTNLMGGSDEGDPTGSYTNTPDPDTTLPTATASYLNNTNEVTNLIVMVSTPTFYTPTNYLYFLSSSNYCKIWGDVSAYYIQSESNGTLSVVKTNSLW